MTRVEQGILINNQHLENVLNNLPEEISFKDQILALGYNNIEEFFEEKAIYEMRNVLSNSDTQTVHMKDLVPALIGAVQNKKYGIINIYTDSTCVCHGNNEQKQLNEEYCERNNIPIYPYNSFGGNIVATKEDYGIAFFIPTSIDISIQLVLTNVASILKKYFSNVTIEGNDILIDNKKVVGSGSFGNDDILCILFYFSMSNKGELIFNICGEPITNKTPGYINSDILSREQLITEVSAWLLGR